MFAVIDTETTGFSSQTDRVIEFAVVALDAHGSPEWEWSTLINPNRDVGPTRIHGIRAADVVNAPTFSELAGYIAFLLNGRVVVGHNVAFDWRMLNSEFERAGYRTPDRVATVCTCKIAQSLGYTPATLAACIELHGITNSAAHSALADARATGILLGAMTDVRESTSSKSHRKLLSSCGSWPPIPIVKSDGTPRPTALPPRPTVESIVSMEQIPFSDIPRLKALDESATYAATLERTMEDRVLDADEVAELELIATELGLNEPQVADAHRTYLASIAAAMWVDGKITVDEHRDLTVAAQLLGLGAEDADQALNNPILRAPAPDNQLRPGDKVVFTGDMDRPRAEWVEDAKSAGLRVTASVSKLTKVVVVADAASQSTKARRAREIGVRVISEHVFARRLLDLQTRSN